MTERKSMKACRTAVLIAALAFVAPQVFAHGDEAHGGHRTGATSAQPQHGIAGAARAAAAAHGVDTAYGRKGIKGKSNRVIRIEMRDDMRFYPSDIKVRQGETIRFEVKNAGKMLHEMVLGTMTVLKGHHAEMQKHPGMAHGDMPNAAHVPPGRTRTLVWHFTKPGEFHYACLLPGHFEAGMIGKIEVEAK